MTPEPPGSTPPTSRPSRIEPPKDRGYRAGARLGPDGDRRARRVGYTAVGLLVGLVALAALDPVLSLPALPFGPDDAAPTARATLPIATPLPDLQRVDALAPTWPLPVLAGGLRWLDPRTGRLSGSPYEGFRGALFVEPDGAVLCVCLEVPWTDEGAIVRVTLARDDGSPGPRTEPLTVLELSSSDRARRGQSIVVDAAISPDHQTVYLAHAVRVGEVWSFGVDAVDAITGIVRARLPIAVGDVGDQAAWPVLRVSPDGRELRLTAWGSGSDGSGRSLEQARSFRIDLLDGWFDGEPVLTNAVGEPEGRDIGCGDEGYVSADRYAALCLRIVDGAERMVLVVDDPKPPGRSEGPTRAILLPASQAASELDYLVRADRGEVFAWSRARHVLSRIDVESGAVEFRNYGFDGAGKPAVATGPRPPAGSGAAWTTLRSPIDLYRDRAMVGARDGSVVFVIGGGDAPVDGLVPATGVWVIDAETLELVDIWPPSAYYDGLALTADGGYVVALGLQGVDAEGRPARFGPSLTFHRSIDGQVVEVIGDIAEAGGWTPVLLSAGG